MAVMVDINELADLLERVIGASDQLERLAATVEDPATTMELAALRARLTDVEQILEDLLDVEEAEAVLQRVRQGEATVPLSAIRGSRGGRQSCAPRKTSTA